MTTRRAQKKRQQRDITCCECVFEPESQQECERSVEHLRPRATRSILKQAPRVKLLLFVLSLLSTSSICRAETRVLFDRNGKKSSVSGRILVEAQDGGILIEGRDRQIFPIQPGDIKQKEVDEKEFKPLTRKELKAKLLQELPSGFQIYETNHYLICYNTSRVYAQWCGALYERLYRAFHNYWRKRNFKLDDATDLVAIVFKDKRSFEQYARDEMGAAASSVIGFYSLTTNRITSYDLTGVDGIAAKGQRISNGRHINFILSRPESERTVATLIHEATHQIAFNSGLQTRFADIPLWLSEGLAIYFESPDLGSKKGWRTIGAVNRVRLQGMRNFLPKRSAGSLKSLLLQDSRFRDPHQATAAYAEAWSLCYFLMKNRPEQFSKYLRTLNEKPPLGIDDPEQRLADFYAAFGDDLVEVDKQLVKTIRLLK